MLTIFDEITLGAADWLLTTKAEVEFFTGGGLTIPS